MEKITIGNVTIEEIEDYVILNNFVGHFTMTKDEFKRLIAFYSYLLFLDEVPWEDK